MLKLVSRFHLLLLTVLVAITGVAFLHIEPGFAFAAHWRGSTADWLWPRNVALATGPLLAILVLLAAEALAHAMGKSRLALYAHVLDPALTLVLSTLAAVQLGFLFLGIGSDLDILRLTGFGLGATLVGLGIVLFEAERHTYAGLRLPWRIRADTAWRTLHRLAGLAFGLAGLAILLVAWLQPDPGPLILSFAGGILVPPLCAGLGTALHPGR